MSKLVLRNDRLDSGAWLFTSAAFALVTLGAFVGLVVANLRDPKALWMGPSVIYPQTVYLFFEGMALVIGLGMVWLAIYKGKKFRDRTVQLEIDEGGIRDHRPPGHDLKWAEIDHIRGSFLESGGIVTVAMLQIETIDGETVGIDILGLDQDHKAIMEAVKKMKRRSARGG